MAQAVQMTVSERDAFARGRTLFERGEIDPALEAFSTLLKTREDFADIHYMVGVLFEQKGDLDAAAESLRKAIRLNPQYAEALLALAAVYEQQGEYDRSGELAERAAMVSRSGPGSLDATTRGKIANLQAAVGDACAEAGERRDAIEAYRKALDHCPTYHDIRHRLGIALREAGLPHQAAKEFKRVLRGNPDFADSRAQLGLIFYSLARSEDALTQWNQVLEQDPGRADVQMYVRLLNGEGSGQAIEDRPSPDRGTEKAPTRTEPSSRFSTRLPGAGPRA